MILKSLTLLSLIVSGYCYADVEIKVTPFYDQLSVTVFNDGASMEGSVVETNSSNGASSITNSYGRTTIPIQIRDSRFVTVNIIDNDKIIGTTNVWIPDYEKSMSGSSY